MKTIKYIAIFISLIVLGESYGQGFYNRGVWKKQRVEWSGGLGASNFLGDLGGRDRIGSDFVWDLEWNRTNFAATFNHMYYLSRKIGLRTNVTYAKVSGNDNLTQEYFRNNRNLNFESHIGEVSMVLEIQFKKEKVGNVYNLKSPAGRKLGLKSMAIGFYGVVGIGGFYYNPKGMDANGMLVPLRPLHTEGQGLTYDHPFWTAKETGEIMKGPKQYSNFSVAIPLGFGIRRSFNRDWGLKVELTHRFTFTDYIDDVSGVYFENHVIREAYGAQAAYFADPAFIGYDSHGPEDGTGGSQTAQTFAGQQRGDATDKDGYMILMVSVYKKIRTQRSNKKRKSSRRVKASF